MLLTSRLMTAVPAAPLGRTLGAALWRRLVAVVLRGRYRMIDDVSGRAAS